MRVGGRDQLGEGRGRGRLELGDRGQGDAPAARAEDLAGDEAPGQQILEAVGQRGARHREQLAGALDQHVLGDVGVAVLDVLAEDVDQAGLEAGRRVLGLAQALGDRVGGAEADAPDLEGQPVRVVADDPDRVLAVALDDARGEGDRHAVAEQEHHHVLDVAVLGERGRDLVGAGAADAVDLGERARPRLRLSRLAPDPRARRVVLPRLHRVGPGLRLAAALPRPRPAAAAGCGAATTIAIRSRSSGASRCAATTASTAGSTASSGAAASGCSRTPSTRASSARRRAIAIRSR
jgi:hypothetical protein